MPKSSIDYSNTIIYMIVCLDVLITDVYVGHTTNFTIRKNKHKSTCTNVNDKHHHLYVYQFIREHGGWDNWDMILLENINCNDVQEARQHERRWIETKQATLNKNVPNRSHSEYKKIYNLTYHLTPQHIEYKQNYRDTHKEQTHETWVKYFNENKDKIHEQRKQYRLENKDKIAKGYKIWYEKNKDKILEKRKAKKIISDQYPHEP